MFTFYRPKSEASQVNSYSNNLAINITFYWFPVTGCSETTSSLLEASERACRGANQLHQSIINVWTLPINVCKNQEEHCSLDRCDPHPLEHQCRRELSSSQLHTPAGKGHHTTARSKLLSRMRDVSLSSGYRRGSASERGGHRIWLVAARTLSEL